MWDLLCSIFFSSLIFVVFRLFDTYKVDTFRAIVVNYITAFTTGLLLYTGDLSPSQVFSLSWAGGALLLGVLFIVIFNVMALTSQRHGVGVASVATKMSLVIPVIAGLILYDEYLSPLQVAGIILALAAVYFTSLKETNRADGKDLRLLFLPLIVFLGSGIIDTAIKYLQETRVAPSEYPLFSAPIFGFASLTGLGILLIKHPSDLKRFNGR
ncbi:MAG: EamA family transporter, partial [Robiginitalea sp.]